MKYRTLNVFTPLSPPLFFSSLGMDNEPCLVLGAWCAKQSLCQVTGEAVPLVPIIPVSQPPHHRHYTSMWTCSLPCQRRTPQPLTRPTPSLAVLRARKVWQRQWVGVLSGDECQTGQRKPPASYNERHLRRTRKDTRRVKEIPFADG